MPFRVWTETDNGAVRKHNEDAFVSRPEIGLWAVADGAGGHASGEVASGMLADVLGALPSGLSAAEMLNACRAGAGAVHDALRRDAAQRGHGAIVASTLVILVVSGGHFACLWAGDSRAYLLRHGAMQQITSDHSLVQELVEQNLIRPDQAETHPQANVITRAVGGDDDVLVLDKVSGQLLPGDRFLLCSDGLNKALPADALARLLAGDGGLGPAAELIAAALEHEASDNVTAVVVEIGHEGALSA